MTPERARGPVLLAVALVALSMRGAIAAVPPLIEELSADLGITRAQAGLLTSLPVLLFAAAAPLAALLGRRLGAGRAVVIGLLLLAVGAVVRVLGGAALLVGGTIVLGVGITVANILVPAVVKRDFGTRASRVTGYFVAAMAVGATLTAALAVPLAAVVGWRAALAAVALFVPPALVGWWLHVARHEPARDASHRGPGYPGGSPTAPPPDRAGHRDGFVWRVPLAWALAVALGSQSALYYSLTAWLPALLTDRADVSAATAGVALSLFQITAIPTALTIAGLCRIRGTQGWIGLVIAASWLVFVGGVLLVPVLWPMWVVVGGLAQGAGFTYVLTLIVLRASGEHVVRALGAMGQLVGYTIGAAGPLASGWLAQRSGDWVAPGALWLALAAALATASLFAGRARVVHAPARHG